MLRAYHRARCHRLIWKLCVAGLVLLTASWTLFGDSSGRLRRIPSPGCYCHCAGAHALGVCTKMCELPRYASRWWATTCAKPRVSSPADNHGAGPRLPHPDRADRASN